jgi:aryl-alcohol dehydrogenase-like predicted oxidoreductase
MEHLTLLGRSDLQVQRMGVGAMTWGNAKGLSRLHPAKTAYGGSHGFEEEKRAPEASLAAGVNLFDTAAIYSGGAAERRLGELARDQDVIVASKYPSGFSFRPEDFPKELEATLARLGRSCIDLYQHHFPSKRASIPKLMELAADAVEAGKVKAVQCSRRSQLSNCSKLLGRSFKVFARAVPFKICHPDSASFGWI